MSEILLPVLLSLVFVRLLNNTSLKKSVYQNRFLSLISVICLATAVSVANIVPAVNPLLYKILVLLFFIIYASIFYLNHFVENLIISITYMITYMFVGYLIKLGYQNIIPRYFPEYSNGDVIVNTLMIFATFLISELILSNILDYKNYVFTNNEFVALFGFSFTGYVIAIFSAQHTFIWGSMLCVVATLLASALIKIIRQKEKNEKFLTERNKFLERQDKLIRENEEAKYKSYKRSIEFNDQLRKIDHDLMHHFNYILSCEGLPKDAKDYIIGLKDVVAKTSDYFDTGSSILDLILEEKCKQAEEKGIKFRVIGDFSDGLILEPESVSVIFSNLLNNAVDSCNKVSEDKYRSIDIVFYQEPKNKLYIKLSNTFNSNKLDNDNQTVKKGKNAYSIGLDNVKKEIEKYDGSIVTSVNDDIFVVEIIIPIR